jgi:outer membrane protein assembly factor BamB
MKMMSVAVALVIGLVLVFSGSAGPPPLRAAGPSANWPQWRGPDGGGVSSDTKLPSEWGIDRNILWKTPVPGRGHSSPIVWGSRVFLTTDVEGPVLPGAKAVTHIIEGKEFRHPDSTGGDRRHSLRVLCFDRESGKVLWEKTAYEGAVYDDRHRKGSYAAPTPATDGDHVYAWFGTEGIYCYGLSGNIVWKSAPGPIATVGMGPGTSPVLFENLVILLCDEDNGDQSFIVALDKRTGREVWRTPRKVEASWATPLVVRSGSRKEIVCSGNQVIVAYNPKTGEELWRSEGLDSNAIPSPVSGQGMVFVSAGFPAKKTFAIRLGGSGDLTDSKSIAWRYEKGTAYVPSTLLYGDFLYLMTDRGILSCLEARTGIVKYENGRIPVPATFTASPVAAGGKIFLTSEDGDTYVIKAGPSHHVLATNSVGEPVYASPAIAGGHLFIRGERNLYCIGNR